MNERNPAFLASFARLQERLYRLKNGTLNPYDEMNSPYTYAHPITDIEGIIFSMGLEDALYSLDYNIEACESILKDLANTLKKYVFTSKFNGWPDGQFIPPTNATEFKKKFKTTISTELNFYVNELTKLRNEVQNKFAKQGDERFSNAGYKLMLDLTVPQIGSFFNLLFETGIITYNNATGDKLTKKKLAEFISRNFSSSREKTISEKSIVNQLSRNDLVAELAILERLDKIKQFADQEPIPKKHSSK